MLEFNLLPFKTFKTKRLILREITFQDAPEIFAFRSDPEAMRFIGRPKAASMNDANELIQKFVDGLKNNDAVTWGITIAEENKVIGTIGLWRMEKEHYRAEIGYMLLPAYWRKGIASEAMEAVLKYAFGELKFHSLEACLVPENTDSAKLLEKFEFKKEGHFKDNYFFEGKFSDTAVYSKLNPQH